MNLSDKQFLFIQDVAKLIQFCVDNGVKITGGELERPQLMQNHYYNIGKSKTRNSKHTLKLAIDLNFFIDGELTYDKEKLQFIGDYWESLSPQNSWGGNWSTFIDTPHFQRNP